MRHGPVLDAASALIDLLVGEAELMLRDRLVLETGLAAAATDNGALWRRSPGEDWHPSIERGRRGGRFEAERVTRRALESPFDPTLPGFSCVRSEIGSHGVALVLAGALDDESEDALEALLTCLSIVELAGGVLPGPASPLPAAAPPRESELGRIQHDVRNALTSLMATQQVLDRFGADLTDDERQAFADAVDRECERTGAILAQGLTGRANPRSGPATTAEIATDVVAVERAAFERVGCRLEIHVADDARLARPACGAEAWSRIVHNLVANAREAATACGARCTIEVGLVGEHAGVRLSIEDRAGGLPEVALPLLFEPGFTTGKPVGTGQGLGVVRDLVLSAGGALLVERRSAGACFEVWMPGSGLAPETVAPQGPECEKKTREGFTLPPERA